MAPRDDVSRHPAYASLYLPRFPAKKSPMIRRFAAQLVGLSAFAALAGVLACSSSTSNTGVGAGTSGDVPETGTGPSPSPMLDASVEPGIDAGPDPLLGCTKDPGAPAATVDPNASSDPI